ncbi:MAG: DNA processing protein DprA [Candidatus Hydrogenedentota bacterium]
MPLTDQQRDWLSLSLVPGVGTAMFIRLLARFTTASRVLSASRAELREVVGPKLAERIAAYKDAVDVDGQIQAMDRWGATFVTLDDAAYPIHLAEIYDPPLGLFVRGRWDNGDEPCVAIVGTRRATPYGIRMAGKFGRELAARGITVVSGLASGIDTAAHQGALEAGGRTVAVLGCGVDVVYPPENRDLMDRIAATGAVVSQFPMTTKPSKGHFPYRNRIISGMSLGVLIVEAPLSSGALITARQAAEQGREVFAVPGQVGVNNSQGPHALIREGAKLVETVEDILVELELPVQAYQAAPEPMFIPATTPVAAPAAKVQAAPQKPAARPEMSPTEQKIVGVLKGEGSYIDEIAEACRLSISEALSSLTLLELKGVVRQFSGKRFSLR